MKRPAAVAAALVLALALTGCGYKAKSGVVIEHVYVPAYESHGTTCVPSGKTTICYPTTYHHDECWKVRVEDDKGHRGSWCLTQIAWEPIELGQYLEVKK